VSRGPVSRLILPVALLAVAAAQAAPPPALPVEQRLERLERRVDRITELTLQVQTLQRENQQLRGEIELQRHTIEAIKRKQRDLYLDVDQRLSRLQPAAAPEPAAAASGPTSPTPAGGTPAAAAPPADEVPPPTAAAVDPAQVEAEYNAAYALLSPEQRRYKEAIAAFRTFLQRHPDSPLAANAQYWLGEASYVTQDNDSALAAFRAVVEKYPDSPKVPGALLKIGYILHATGKPEEAETVLGRVIQDYPGSSAARMAHQRLARIQREAH